MIIKEVVNLAKYSELAGVAAKDNIDAIVAFINLGMIELYTRFPLKVEETLVSLVDNQIYYNMPANFMYPISAFGEVEEFSEVTAKEIGINDEDDPLSVYFPSWSVMQVPSPTQGSYISVIYVAKPATITAVQADDGVTELPLPDVLIDALLSYIGFRGHLGVKSDAQSENNAHWIRFEQNCAKAEKLGIAYPANSLSMSKRLYDRGFV